MSNTVRRLLFSTEPYFDESFISYVMRLAELNSIPDFRWILFPLKPRKFSHWNFDRNFDFQIDMSRFTKLTKVDKNLLENILYSYPDRDVRQNDEGSVYIDNYTSRYYIERENPKICPRCLREQNYCRKIWEISLVTACPLHKCLLMDYCPQCRQTLSWKRPAVNLCECNYDFREMAIFHLKEIELRISRYFYQRCYLNDRSTEQIFNFPLNTLSEPKLFKLLLFASSHFSRCEDLLGEWFFSRRSNILLHSYLTAGINVFENWSENFHIFVRDWHKWETRAHRDRKTIDLWNHRNSYQTQDYEALNFILSEYFYAKPFRFLQEEFDKFIEKFVSENLPEQPLLFDKYSIHISDIHQLRSVFEPRSESIVATDQTVSDSADND